MSTKFQYCVKLTSDAEPGTGLGGDLVDSLIPRDHSNHWQLNSTHIKGLMRQAVKDLVSGLGRQSEPGWSTLADRTFGRGDSVQSGQSSTFYLTDAVADQDSAPLVVTRTAIGEHGLAKDKSLRTAETVPVGSEFNGQLYCNAGSGSSEQIAWQLGLLSIPAVGGNRNRGCGRCVTELTLDKQSISSLGNLLEQLDKVIKSEVENLSAEPTAAVANQQSADLSNDKTVVVRLTFVAESPICCPETADKTNVIASGFSIPASAIQGLILHRINDRNAGLATALFNHDSFRVWPMHPVARESVNDHNYPVAVRVSLTHRAAKFFDGSVSPESFQDEAIEPYKWQDTTHGAPLKASDGVLLVTDSGDDRKIELWKSANMPHVITSHGVRHDLEKEANVDDSRNLFTVDAMAPMVWQGLVALPESAANELKSALEESSIVSVGKSRSVRGIGELIAEVAESSEVVEWQSSGENTVLVVQSPIAVPDDELFNGKPAEQILETIARQWAKHHQLTLPGLPDERTGNCTWASMGIRFGWSRLDGKRQSAKNVILPGSVICFPEKLDQKILTKAIMTGMHANPDQSDKFRTHGFGAVAIHPGIAKALFASDPKIRKVDDKASAAIKIAIKIAESGKPLPSASQIRAVQQRVEKNGQESAKEYLKTQCERPGKIWSVWQGIVDQIESLLEPSKFDADSASRALTVLANLKQADGKGN